MARGEDPGGGRGREDADDDRLRPGRSGERQFLFINDLTAKATGATLVVLIVLYVGSQLLSSVLMSVTADRNQRFIMIALPFVFVPFIQGFPAGLLVYWITTNLWTVGQQYIIRRGAGLPVLGAPGRGRSPPRAAAVSDEGRERPNEGEGRAEAAVGANGDDAAPGARAARAPDERSAPAATPAAQEEDRKAPMSADVVESTVQEVLEEVVTALGLKATSRSTATATS